MIKEEPLQQIFYGAPGTGKSHTIKQNTQGEKVIRTTFHPDSDYSTFVGAYKPTMEGGAIKYKFVKQAFLKAYLLAWKMYASSKYSKASLITNDFEIPETGHYTISSVESNCLILSREFNFPKKLVSDEWPKLWKSGEFVVPSGRQPGKSVQYAIAIWIKNQFKSCSENIFEEGWKTLLLNIQTLKRVGVINKTQTYYLSLIDGKDDVLKVTVLEARKYRDNLQKIYEGKKSSYKLDNKLVSILKEYESDNFDEAWKKLKEDIEKGAQMDDIEANDGDLQSLYLIIEEINRGNCAQIFGDLFQLLDRSDNGFSTYPIEADTDLRDAIKIAFEKEDEYKLDYLDIDDEVEDYISNYDETLSDDVKNGRVLLLPPNLYIWATMNTSDQSLFPIDSAFKRRWDWKYVKIAKGRDRETKKELDWNVSFDYDEENRKFQCKFDWWDFILAINEKIAEKTSSDDKKLGYFFCKPKDEDSATIDADTFVGKVIFYLWNDVLKEEEPALFKVYSTKGEPSFDSFYIEDKNGNTVVDTRALKDFAINIFGEGNEKLRLEEIKKDEDLVLTP